MEAILEGHVGRVGEFNDKLTLVKGMRGKVRDRPLITRKGGFKTGGGGQSRFIPTHKVQGGGGG